MDKTTATFGVIALLIVSFTTIEVLNDEGIPMEPTHACYSIGKKMYCARTTAYFCYPSNETRVGSKKCEEGWKEIPILKEKSTNKGNIEICPPNGCYFLII